MRLTRRALLASSATLVAMPVWAQRAAPAYRNPRAPVALRVRNLLEQMTIEEKAAQLRGLAYRKAQILDLRTGAFSPEKAAVEMPHGIGQIGRPSDTVGMPGNAQVPFREPEDTVAFINDAQRYAVERTRLGIPMLFHEETAHGLAVKGATSFPIPPGLASTWDPDLVERIFTHVARQARGRGATVALCPVLDLIRDPRWGRSEEFFGEDPFLVGEFATAAVRGLQGRSRPIAADRVFSTLKHFVHGTPQNGINLGPSDMSERALRETFLPPFKKAIQDAHVAIVMPSYNEVGGVPSHANRHLLQEVGRNLLGFEGPYFSDYNGIEMLATLHHMAEDKDEAAVLAMRAGVDCNLPEGEAYADLPALVQAGRIPIESVDAAVARVLALKFEAGLFEHPYVDPALAARVLADPAGPPLARLAAQKAIVMLTNDGILPLDRSRHLKLAVIGPNSVEARLGGYSGLPDKAVGVLEGLKAAIGPAMTIEQADGAWITQPDSHGQRSPTHYARPVPPADNEARIKEAAALAARSDVVLLVVGDNEQITRETLSGGTPGDRDMLTLFGDQDRLVEAVLAAGKPVVALLLNGRPLSVTTLADKANALLEGWYLGEQGGNAVADVLFGKVSPGGKLTVSIPRSVGDLPVFYNRHPSSVPNRYIETRSKALFPFGHGLSYTTFEVSEPRLVKASIAIGETAQVEIDVANTGSRLGDEVVQLYIRDDVSSVPRPVLELRGFERVTLKPGERKTVRFALTSDALAFWGADMDFVVEPGTFTISAGPSSASLKSTKLTVA